MQNIQQLPFVHMETFHLDIEHEGGVHLLTPGLQDIIRQDLFTPLLDLPELVPELRILGKRRQVAKLVRMQAPAVADGAVNKPRQFRVGLDQPASVADAVGLVVKAVRETLVQGMQGAVLQNLAVDSRHAVDAVAAHHG